MAIPTWVSGQILTASDVNTFFVPRAVVKGSTQSVTSSTALVNDTALVLTVDANAIYEMIAHIIYDCSTTGDFKTGWTAPAGATMDWVSNAAGTNATAGVDLTSHTAQTIGSNGLIGGVGAGTSLVAPMHGILTTVGTAGSLQFQWAQNTSDGTATRVFTGSTLILRRIG